MDLVGRLSNHDLTTLYQGLMARDWKQAGRRHPSVGGVAPDGRRKFGTIRDAIVIVLEQANCEQRVRDIHAGVEELFGEPVSRGSVKAYLCGDSRRRTPLFERCGTSGYRLRR